MCSRANRFRNRKRSSNLLRQVCCNSQSDYCCHNEANMNSGRDARATHGDGVCAMNRLRQSPGYSPACLDKVFLFAKFVSLPLFIGLRRGFTWLSLQP
jgi:hypothetical protein